MSLPRRSTRQEEDTDGETTTQEVTTEETTDDEFDEGFPDVNVARYHGSETAIVFGRGVGCLEAGALLKVQGRVDEALLRYEEEGLRIFLGS